MLGAALTRDRAKIIENLAVVDYDTNNLYLAAYDWRVSMWNLEERDGYFSKLKGMIEGLRCVYVGSADGMPDWNAACVGSGKGNASCSSRTRWALRYVALWACMRGVFTSARGLLRWHL